MLGAKRTRFVPSTASPPSSHGIEQSSVPISTPNTATTTTTTTTTTRNGDDVQSSLLTPPGIYNAQGHSVPFPYTPYPLQLHAMGELRTLLQSNHDTVSSIDSQKTTTTHKQELPPKSSQACVAVLEAPTGTGKSQMLLNSVLSHLFVVSEANDTGRRTATQDGNSSDHSSKDGVADENRSRVKTRRLLKRTCVKPMKGSNEDPFVLSQGSDSDDARDTRGASRYSSISVTEGGQTNTEVRLGNEGKDEMQKRRRLSFLWSSSSSDNSESDGGGEGAKSHIRRTALHEKRNIGDEENVGDDDEEEESLSELRKPKVYFASRTHTQLQQLTDELRKSAFGQRNIRRRAAASDGVVSHETPARPLQYVHVAGRQQLCINAAIRRSAGGNVERLNELCTEAMRYERSKEGREARKAAVAAGGAGGGADGGHTMTLPLTGFTRVSSTLNAKPQRADEKPKQRSREEQTDDFGEDYGGATHKTFYDSLPDMEDVVQSKEDVLLLSNASTISAKRQGCEFCALKRLQLFDDYLDVAPRSLTEMKDIGMRIGACPFLASRRAVRSADVVLIPYSYLADEHMRDILLGGSSTNDGAENGDEIRPGLDSSEANTKDYEEHNDSGKSHDVDGDNLLALSYISNRAADRRAKVMQKWAGNRNGAGGPPGGAAGSSYAQANSMEGLDALPPNLSGDIVVVDEAHNLFDQCREMSRVDIDARALQHVRLVLQSYLDRYESRLLVRNKQRLREMIRFTDKLVSFLRRWLERKVKNSSTHSHPSSPADAAEVSEVLTFSSFLFDADVDTVNVLTFLNFLDDTRLIPKLLGLLQQLIIASAADATHSSEGPGGSGSHELHQREVRSRAVHYASSCVRRYMSLLEWYSRSDEFSRVIISTPTQRGPVAEGSEDGAHLRLLQLEPGRFTFFPVILQAETVILAGGTMSPLPLTTDPLACVPSPPVDASSSSSEAASGTLVRRLVGRKSKLIRTGHVVPPTALKVFTLPSGPNGLRLDFRYQSRQEREGALFQEVAIGILRIAQTVPAGMIVFFTSYDVEEQFVAYLTRSPYYSELQRVKRIFRESATRQRSTHSPSSMGDSNAIPMTAEELLASYAEWILGGVSNTNSSHEGPRMKQQRTENREMPGVTASNGAVMFCVMGGKLSEGINFNDDLGRCVVVVGVPYPNARDVELQLYLQHLATYRSNNESSEGTISMSSGALGTMDGLKEKASWDLYTALCMRTVNQTIGRCIRHQHDYATVVLMDARYGERSEILRGLSPWMRGSLSSTRSFDECLTGIQRFFNDRLKKMD